MTDANGTIRLEGRLTVTEVSELESRYQARFDGRSPPEAVSLAGVDSGDSSALALLLEWQARARRSGNRIRFEQPPENLRVIARLTGVAPLLGWSEEEKEERNMKSAKDRA